MEAVEPPERAQRRSRAGVVQRGGEPEPATLASNRVSFASVPQLRGWVGGRERGVAGWVGI